MGGRGASSGGGGASLKKNEQNAIEYYVSGEGMWINNYFRNDGSIKELTDFESDFVKGLDSATNRTLKEQTLYRSVDAKAIFGNISDDDYYDLTQYMVWGGDTFGDGRYGDYVRKKSQFLANRAKGRTIIDKGFVSTTTDYNVANEWRGFSGSSRPVVLEIKTNKKTKGVDVSYTDKKAYGAPQKEILLARNQKFKVTDISGKNGQIYVKVEMN